MYVTIKKAVEFSGRATSAEERKLLREAGFVHATGLSVSYGPSILLSPKEDGYIIGEKLTIDQVGKWDYNNGITVIVTTGGEVWISATLPKSNLIARQEALNRLCPHGKGAFVPLSNGETISAHVILERVADPNHGLVSNES